jgi:HAD superfamily hydrolase (TIGR01509 family)
VVSPKESTVAVRAVISDIGGVVVHTPTTGWRERWEERLGLAAGRLWHEMEPICLPGLVGASTLGQIQSEVQMLFGLSDQDSKALWDDVWAEYLGSLNVEWHRYLQGLRPKYATALLSNSFVGAREREQQRYGIEALCDEIVYSHEVGLCKPDPEVYLLTCRWLGVRPQEAVFVDDSADAIAGARDVGLYTIHHVETDKTISAVEQVLHRSS